MKNKFDKEDFLNFVKEKFEIKFSTEDLLEAYYHSRNNKNKLKELETISLAEELYKMTPNLKVTPSGRSLRVSKNSFVKKLKELYRIEPDLKREEIIKASRNYIEYVSSVDGHMCSPMDYFLVKDGVSKVTSYLIDAPKTTAIKTFLI